MVQKDSSIQILLSILGVISLILITVGVSFAFFTYEKEMQIENNWNNGKLSLIYTENIYSERGITITSITPVDDSLGKKTNADKYIFDFRITADSSNNPEIPYEITLRKDSLSELDEKFIKVYLTELNEEEEWDTPLTISSGRVKTFNLLEQTSLILASEEIEKTIYYGTVPANTKNYEKKFRLRVWVSDEIIEDMNSFVENNEGSNPLFQVKLNVYASAKTVSKGEIVEATGLTFNDISPMVVGGTQELSANFLPVTTTDKSLSWASSNPEIVAITPTENGKVILTALQEGKSTIQAISKNGICQTVEVSVLTNPF